jgi:YD repeat-containing protein
VTGHKQTTDGQEYTTGYTYNLSGALVEQTYPSGRVGKNTFDADGALSQVQSKRSSETYRNFANGFVYNAAGAVTAMRLGNGRWENTTFNSRLQPTQIGLGAGAYSQSLLKLEYSYGTTANNGNVVEQKITVPGVTHPFVQAYTYDELNRLASAEETQNTSTQIWKQTFTYDRFGNRNFNTSGNNTTTLPQSFDPDIYNPTISTTNNRFDSGQGYSYDSSGNTTADAEGRTFVYDAENKQVEVIESSVTIGEYFYDGDGKRVKKIAGSEETIFVYDAGGKLIGEYSSIVQTGSNAKTVYTTNDHLGSPRINTDGVGAVISRHDYHPWTILAKSPPANAGGTDNDRPHRLRLRHHPQTVHRL